LSTNTTLLLGLWASAGDQAFSTQLKCLQNAIKTYPEAGKLLVGISVGSEDLYRSTPTALANSKMDGAEPPVGADAATVLGYIKQVRSTVKGTSYESPIGHVDTWSVWVDGSNKDVVAACDWIGFDGYPYWEKENNNDISNGRKLFKEALDNTRAACPGKEIWITETGWPTAGATVGAAEASPANAQTYWQDVGCSLYGVTNTWWFTLQGMPDGAKEPSWGVLNSKLDSTPLFDLSCKGVAT
jgi:glucan endo-1,3-beta-D-glucosidase